VLQDRMDGYSDIEHIKRIKEFFLPKVANFSDMIDQLLDDNNKVKECIRGFDANICKKANKVELRVIREELEARFIHIDKWKEVLIEFKNMDKRFEKENLKLDERFAKFKLDESR